MRVSVWSTNDRPLNHAPPSEESAAGEPLKVVADTWWLYGATSGRLQLDPGGGGLIPYRLAWPATTQGQGWLEPLEK